jgi:NAD(P)-dependent dehydrogenase (short-subunit alcohol dehydrogenase family)
LRQLSSGGNNTVIGLVRTPTIVEKRLAADSIQNVHLIQADMADNNSLVTAATEVKKLTGGSVDYLIINGAYTNPAENFLSPTEFSGKEVELTNSMIESLKVNVLGAICSINAFLALVRNSNIKKIIVITTGLSDRDMTEKSTFSHFVTYSSMKAALNIVVAKYAVELKSEGIVLLALSPGLVDTTSDKPASPRKLFVKERDHVLIITSNP